MKKYLEAVKEMLTLPNILASTAALYALWYITGGQAIQLIKNLPGPLAYLDDALALALAVFLGQAAVKRFMAKRK